MMWVQVLNKGMMKEEVMEYLIFDVIEYRICLKEFLAELTQI